MSTAAAQPKTKKTASSKKLPSHPTFAEMITDAISSLKERTGSSQYAITKFIEEKHKNLPPTFRKLLLHNLKKSVAAGKLVKVKNSFKLAPKAASPPAPVKAPAKASSAAAAKPKAAAASKPGPKPVSKPKAKPAAITKKAAAKPKAKSAPASAKPKRKPKANAPAKKVAAKPVKKMPVKKPKSVKSPAKKAAAKKTKK